MRKLHTLRIRIFFFFYSGGWIHHSTSRSVINRFLLQNRKTMTNFEKFRSLSHFACRNRFCFLERIANNLSYLFIRNKTRGCSLGFFLDARKLLLSLLWETFPWNEKEKLITIFYEPTDILNLSLSLNNHFHLEDLEPIKTSFAYLRAERIFINSIRNQKDLEKTSKTNFTTS